MRTRENARTDAGKARPWMRAFIICSGWPLVGTVKTGTPRQTASQMVSLPVEQMIPAGAEGGAAGERSVERAVDLPPGRFCVCSYGVSHRCSGQSSA